MHNKKQLNISMCLYVRTGVVAYKSAYSGQCVCYFYEISVHCCPSNTSQVFSVNISTAFQCSDVIIKICSVYFNTIQTMVHRK